MQSSCLPGDELRPWGRRGWGSFPRSTWNDFSYLLGFGFFFHRMATVPPSRNPRGLNGTRREISRGVCACDVLVLGESCLPVYPRLHQTSTQTPVTQSETWSVLEQSMARGHSSPHSLMVQSTTFCIRPGFTFRLSYLNRHFSKEDKKMLNTSPEENAH